MNKKNLASFVGAVWVLALSGGELRAVEVAPEAVVTANRAATPRGQVGSSVTVIDPEELQEEGVHTLEDALRRSPGVFSESIGGQRGSVSSLFLRGTGTAQSHFQVDGIRLSDSSVSSGNFLGNAMLGGAGSIEVLRGPQSALYGPADRGTGHLSVVYFPMAILAVVILGYTGALSPHIVIPAIFRGGWIYWIGVFLLLVLYLVGDVVEDMFSGRIILGHLIMALVGSYTLMTNARILGVVFRERQEKLGWL